jgi:hypothetical protein
MTIEQTNHQTILQIASMRFKTIVTETKENQSLILELPPDATIHGFIVLLQPALPSIV